MSKLKTACGRGSQSDWAPGNRGSIKTDPAVSFSQRRHTEEAERKKAAKRRRRAERVEL